MKQINVSVDDGLYQVISAISNERGTSVPDLIRATLRSLEFKKRIVKISLMGEEKNYEVESEIHKFLIGSSKIWCGKFLIPVSYAPSMSFLFTGKPKEIVVKFDTGKTSVAIPVAFSGKTGQSLEVAFVGVTSIPEDE